MLTLAMVFQVQFQKPRVVWEPSKRTVTWSWGSPWTQKLRGARKTMPLGQAVNIYAHLHYIHGRMYRILELVPSACAPSSSPILPFQASSACASGFISRTHRTQLRAQVLRIPHYYRSGCLLLFLFALSFHSPVVLHSQVDCKILW